MSKKTFETVIASWNDAILQLKANQKSLLQDCVKISETQKAIDTFNQTTKWHWRIEYRKIEIFNAINLDSNLSLKQPWSTYLKVTVKVTRTRKVLDTKTRQWIESKDNSSFYLSTIKTTAKVFAHAIRHHWWIENKNHNVRDVTMWEDNSRIRINPQNFAKLRSVALNMMRKKNVKNISNETYGNSLNIGKMLKRYGGII